MLYKFLSQAARSMLQHQCAVSRGTGRQLMAAEVSSLKATAHPARPAQLDSIRGISAAAWLRSSHTKAVLHHRPHSAVSALLPRPSGASAPARQLATIVQAQPVSLRQRSALAGRPAHSHTGPLLLGWRTGQRGQWHRTGQLYAAQNFNIWKGGKWRDEERSFDRPGELQDARLVMSPAESTRDFLPPDPLTRTQREKKATARELHTVNVAISTNFAIFLAKLGVFSFTGSNALFAEAIHSLADVANQALLWVGIKRSKRKPTKLHPYGYMRDKFVFSLISAVGIFCLGAGVSVWHGFAGLMEGATVEHIQWSFAVLALSFVLESASLIVAIRSVREGAEAAGLSFVEYVKRGIDPTSVAVMMEDGGAVAGLFVAGACTGLVHLTGQVAWDSIGSICVGVMMGVTAWFLISRNRQMLIGRSMEEHDMEAIVKHLEADPVVEAVYDAKSEEIGPGIFRFKAEIDFSGEEVVQRHMNGSGRAQLLRRMQAASANEADLDHALKAYGEEIINSVGAEVDRIETEIQRINPGIRYVDLETDRGQASTWPRSRRVVTPAEVGGIF